MSGTEGLLFVKVNGLRTLTGWQNKEAMLAFRNNGHHLTAMKQTRRIGKAKSVIWHTQTQPSWTEAQKKLNKIGF